MSREWSYSGVGNFNLCDQDKLKSNLSDSAIKNIRNVLPISNCKLPKNWEKPFQDAIKKYVWAECAKESTKPSKIRANIKASIEACKRIVGITIDEKLDELLDEFNDSVNSLDIRSRILLSEAPGELTKIIEEMYRYSHELLKGHEVDYISVMKLATESLNILEFVLSKAEEYPKHGRLHEHHRTQFAAEVAKGMAKLRVKVTGYRNGDFVEILGVILSDIEGKEIKSVHTLAEKAIFQLKEENFN